METNRSIDPVDSLGEANEKKRHKAARRGASSLGGPDIPTSRRTCRSRARSRAKPAHETAQSEREQKRGLLLPGAIGSQAENGDPQLKASSGSNRFKQGVVLTSEELCQAAPHGKRLQGRHMAP